MQCAKCGKELDPGSSFCTACGSPQLSGIRITVGRDPASDIVLDNQRVSRRHAVITQQGGQLSVADQNSVNGVFVNGTRVSQAAIKAGDSIMLGNDVLLDWNQINSALQRKGGAGSAGQAYPPNFAESRPQPSFQSGFPDASEPYSPVFVQEAPLRRKHRPYLLIGLIILLLAGVGFGAWFLLFRDSGNYYEPIRISKSHTYNMVLGEEKDMSLKRSRLETLEDVLDVAADTLATANSLMMNYCLLDVIVHDEPTAITQGVDYIFRGNGQIIRSGATSITKKDYEAREEYLNGRSDYLAKIRQQQAALPALKANLKQAEAALIAVAKGEEGLAALKRSVGLEEGEDYQGPRQGGEGFDLFQNPRENYEKALSAWEEAYSNLDSVKKDVLSVNSKNKRQKMRESPRSQSDK